MEPSKIVVKAFHELTVDELYEILRARLEVFGLEQGIVYQDMDFIDKKSLHLFITDEVSGGIKAYLRIIEPGVKYSEPSIGRVLTMPEFRKSGYGREIMKFGIEETTRRFGLPLRIEAQEYLLQFYESLGFRSVSESFILEGIPHIEMILEYSD